MTQNKKIGSSAEFGRARDEMFSHIHRCGVLKATGEQQTTWMEDTMEFMAERYPNFSDEELAELRAIGLRFCQPVIISPAVETADEGEAAAA